MIVALGKPCGDTAFPTAMYAPRLKARDKGGAIAAVVAIHAALLFAFLHLSGRIDLADPQAVMRVFDVRDVPPPPPEPPPVQPKVEQKQQRKPKEPEAAAAPENIKSQATPIVAPKPRIPPPIPLPVAVTQTPNQGAAPTQGSGDRPGPGTGAGGVGTGTGSGAGGSGTGGGGDDIGVVPPQLLTGVLRGRDFPRELLDAWPRGAQLFARLRVDARGYVIECHVDRGTGDPAIDSAVCNTIRSRFRFRPALNRRGEAVAGWFGYRQTPPR
jgi:protein TonB